MSIYACRIWIRCTQYVCSNLCQRVGCPAMSGHKRCKHKLTLQHCHWTLWDVVLPWLEANQNISLFCTVSDAQPPLAAKQIYMDKCPSTYTGLHPKRSPVSPYHSWPTDAGPIRPYTGVDGFKQSLCHMAQSLTAIIRNSGVLLNGVFVVNVRKDMAQRRVIHEVTLWLQSLSSSLPPLPSPPLLFPLSLPLCQSIATARQQQCSRGSSMGRGSFGDVRRKWCRVWEPCIFLVILEEMLITCHQESKIPSSIPCQCRNMMIRGDGLVNYVVFISPLSVFSDRSLS